MQEDGLQPQLYNLANDVGETKNLAAQEPQIVQRLAKSVLDWNQTLPVVKLPAVDKFSDAIHFALKKGDTLGRFQAPHVDKHGFTIKAKFDAKAPGGVIVAQGGVAQGYSLFLDKDGKAQLSGAHRSWGQQRGFTAAHHRRAQRGRALGRRSLADA